MEKKILSNNLNKYNSTEQNFINCRINNIIFPKKSRFLSTFLDNLIYNDYTDFLSTFYSYNLSKIYFNQILLFQKQKYYLPCYIQSNINLILKRRFNTIIKSEKIEEKNISKQFQIYTKILPSNIQDSKSINNHLSQNSQTIIDNLGVNDDITITIDLNINQKYDYNELDKNIDFINEKNTNDDNNNTIGELLTEIIKKEKMKQKLTYVQIKQKSKNNNLRNENTIFKTKMKKRITLDENNKNNINIIKNNLIKKNSNTDNNIIKNKNNNIMKRKNNYQMNFKENTNNYTRSKTRKNSHNDDLIETKILLTDTGIKTNKKNIFLCVRKGKNKDDNRKTFKEIVKKENQYKISETFNNNSLATTSNSISNQITPISNKLKSPSINIKNNTNLKNKNYSKNIKKINNQFTINLKKQLSRNIYYSKALDNFANKFLKTSENSMRTYSHFKK